MECICCQLPRKGWAIAKEEWESSWLAGTGSRRFDIFRHLGLLPALSLLSAVGFVCTKTAGPPWPCVPLWRGSHRVLHSSTGQGVGECVSTHMHCCPWLPWILTVLLDIKERQVTASINLSFNGWEEPGAPTGSGERGETMGAPDYRRQWKCSCLL